MLDNLFFKFNLNDLDDLDSLLCKSANDLAFSLKDVNNDLRNIIKYPEDLDKQYNASDEIRENVSSHINNYNLLEILEQEKVYSY
jgi:hypothetical protein